MNSKLQSIQQLWKVCASLEKHSNLSLCAIYLPIILSVVGFYLSHHAMDKTQGRDT